MKVLWPFFGLLARHRGWMIGGGFLALLTWGASVGLLAVSGWFLTSAALAGASVAGGVLFNVFFPSAGIRLFAMTRTVSRYGERVVTHEATFRALADLRTWVFAKAVPLAPAKLGTLAGGDLLSRITGDVDALDGLYLRLALPTGVALVALIGVTLLLGLIDPLMAAGFALLFVAASIVMPAAAARMGTKAARETVTATTALRQAAIDGVRGLADLTTMGRLETQAGMLKEAGDRLIGAQSRIAHLTGLAAAGGMLATGGTILLVLWLGLPQVAEGSLPGPILALALFVALAAFEAATPLAAAWALLGRLTQAADRLSSLARIEPAVRDPETPLPVPGDGASLHFDQVSFRYPNMERLILDHVSITLRAGERVALIGESGVGKSSLAHLALRIWDPVAGQVRLDGVPLQQMDLARLRRRVGLLSQRADLFAASIADNLRIARPDAPESALWHALEQAQLADFVRGLPDGLETAVGEQGVAVSGGQGRRLALARLILADPAIWVLDEPTQGLDAATERALWQTLNAVTQDRTVLLIAHGGFGLSQMDRTYRLIDGRLGPV